jgi:hypothetical protein
MQGFTEPKAPMVASGDNLYILNKAKISYWFNDAVY